MALNSLSNSFNSNNTGGRSGRSSGPLIKNKALGTLLIFLIILLVIFCIVMIGIAASFPKRVDSKGSNEEVLLNFIHNCKNNPLRISTKSISASSSGNEYSLTFWFFINDLDSNYLKDSTYPHLDIFTKGLINPAVDGINTDKSQPIKVYLERKSNSMIVDLKDISSQADMTNVSGCYEYDAVAGPEISLTNMHQSKNTVDSCSIETLRLNNNYFGMDSQNKCYYINNGDVLDFNSAIQKGIYTKTDDTQQKCIEDPLIPLSPAPASEVEPGKKIYIKRIEMASSDSPCRVEQVPIQRWNCITLNVHNNIADLFMDGKLLHTCVHSNNILLNNDPIMIGNRGGFDGYVSNVTWSTKALTANEIYERYSRGPRIRLTVNDRIKYMFMKKPKEIEVREEEIDYVNQESTGRL